MYIYIYTYIYICVPVMYSGATALNAGPVRQGHRSGQDRPDAGQHCGLGFRNV